MARSDEVLHGLIRDAHTYQRLARKAQRSLALSPSAGPVNELAGLLREIRFLSQSQSSEAKRLLAEQLLRQQLEDESLSFRELGVAETRSRTPQYRRGR